MSTPKVLIVDETPLMARMAVAAPAGELNAGSVIEFMAMPSGTHTCWFRQGDRPTERTVIVNNGAAKALNDQLKAVNNRGKQRAFFDFDHEDKAASAWPVEFLWKDAPEPGVYCRAELSQAGAQAIAGKNYRSFSPVFYVTKKDPANVICKEDADLNFGSLVNDPAFHEISPLWAKDPRGQQNAAGAPSSSNKGTSMTEQELAALQAKVTTLEQENTALKGKATTAQHDDAVKAKDGEIVQLKAKLQDADKAIKAQRTKDATDAVQAAVKRGALPAKDQALQAKWQGWCETSPEMIEALNKVEGNPALQGGRITHDGTRLEAKEGPQRIMRAYGALVAKNSKMHPDYDGFRQKGMLAREMAAIYAKEIRGNRDISNMPLTADDATDANLGVLSGTLVAQRTLELFKLQFPAINAVYTDFSDTPAQFNQTENTRIVTVPSIVSYDATLDATGRPKGWTVTVPAATTDVPIKLDEHIGVPIIFDSNQLASTMRRLFDEQAPAASYAFAKYFVEKIYKLMKPAAFNGYAVVNGAKVPVAFPSFTVAQGDFARSSLVKISTIFNPNEVPMHDRTALLVSSYFGQLAVDPSLVTFYAGQQKPDMITDNMLPKMGTFNPIEAPNLTNNNNTPNLVGFAMQKSAVVVKSRLSNDYTQALPGSSYGSVTTITDPDLGISVVLVEYVNHTGGYAEWRIQGMIGAAVGDKRAGLCILSQ